MAQKKSWTSTLKGKPAAVALAVIVLVGGFGILSRGETHDPDLRAALRAELVNRLGGRTGQELEELGDDPTQAEVENLIERADASGIEIHSMKVSGPVGSGIGEWTEVAVLFEYSLPGGERVEEAWLMERLGGSWRYRRETGKMTYYLNLF